MNALTVQTNGTPAAALREMAEPHPDLGSVLIEAVAVGVCGTDREIIRGEYGTAPAGEDYLIIGHESLGRVIEAPASSGISPGDLVVGIVRRPDPIPCASCSIGEWDMCRNGLYTEHGIKELHGFCAERFRLEPDEIVKVDPRLGELGILLEPASVIAKAWEQIDRIGARAYWKPERVLVTGAGPIGLLAALIGVQRGLEVHVLDLFEKGLKPDLVRDLGAQYHVGKVAAACSAPDVVLECTGVGQLVFDVLQCSARNGIVCLTGISSGVRKVQLDMAALNRTMVLENDVVFGSVNANHRHYVSALKSLLSADPAWLRRLITRQVPIAQWEDVLERPADDIKTVIRF